MAPIDEPAARRGRRRGIDDDNHGRVAAVLGGAIFVAWGLAIAWQPPERVESAATALALLLGGWWTLYQFVLRRAFESALAIDVSCTSSPYEDAHLLFVDVTLTNRGPRRITAPERLTDDQIRDFEESIRFPADLQLKMICPPMRPCFVGWWTSRATSIAGVPEHVSLLYEYSRSDQSIDFFMEPGEAYHLGGTFLVPPGDYLIKVVFVGRRSAASEFWSRIVYTPVPVSERSERETLLALRPRGLNS